jgi:hypothetical protein
MPATTTTTSTTTATALWQLLLLQHLAQLPSSCNSSAAQAMRQAHTPQRLLRLPLLLLLHCSAALLQAGGLVLWLW